MHADRTSRVVLLLLGLLMVAAGLAATLASSGVYGNAWAARTLTGNPVGTYAGAQGRWLWPVVGVVALAILVLALRWLVAILFGTDRVRDLAFPTGSRDRVVLAASAVSEAVAAEVEGYRGVRTARARLVGSDEHPELALRVETDIDADLAAVRERIEHDAVAHARQALDRPELPVRLDLETKAQPGRRVL
ncbi:alkaline shock response membrane anchor protein AmaP [Hamadaea tsunoensis]|uniref:alkaline shock response membrane anchor protein AmaP n=1 Tax=Hamadaea tsunoensis TaxID=53368 RepID=UPI000423DF7B|nr:alkaline shock response membrane anchor protein AmaP [Hamadaea tsunoensis]